MNYTYSYSVSFNILNQLQFFDYSKYNNKKYFNKNQEVTKLFDVNKLTFIIDEYSNKARAHTLSFKSFYIINFSSPTFHISTNASSNFILIDTSITLAFVNVKPANFDHQINNVIFFLFLKENWP